eukprot:CAMPEP_0172907204 /NCGR_PEP_ID=MMETSP1075-20121228/178378_1 /TAXON_ID=2916 /ORGANISM="Ceratium fusus, Strain PA161109" /LENGTH=175 /DNA_ID=CAMNT_0013764779 /DNA_START=12 /DNA_END=539 /DNA_ORIENTATION=+
MRVEKEISEEDMVRTLAMKVENETEVEAEMVAEESLRSCRCKLQLPLHDAMGRVLSDDVKQAVNKVMMPKLMAHQDLIMKAKLELKRGNMTCSEMKEAIHASSQQFDLRYAEAIETAKLLANQNGQIELKRLVSSDASWAAVELYAVMSGDNLEDVRFPLNRQLPPAQEDLGQNT